MATQIFWEFSPRSLGKIFTHFDDHIFFKWVGSITNQECYKKWRFSLGCPRLKMVHVILVVTSQHPGRGPYPKYTSIWKQGLIITMLCGDILFSNVLKLIGLFAQRCFIRSWCIHMSCILRLMVWFNPAEPKQYSKACKKLVYPRENKHGNGKSPFSIGNISSNGGFSMVMLVFSL